MKVYSIGREHGCDIEIDDNSDVISRRHATLKVSSSGSMTITDISQNGTYVNGIKISSNVEVPVTRNDSISFAHVYTLDWNMIPNPRAAIIRYAIAGILAVALIVCGIYGYKSFSGGKTPASQPPIPMAVDSLSQDANAAPDSVNTQQPNDSIANDSLKDQKENAKKKVVKKKDSAKKDSPKKEPEPEKKEEAAQKKRFH
jgi:predicted component of type VI protein secretion system